MIIIQFSYNTLKINKMDLFGAFLHEMNESGKKSVALPCDSFRSIYVAYIFCTQYLRFLSNIRIYIYFLLSTKSFGDFKQCEQIFIINC